MSGKEIKLLKEIIARYKEKIEIFRDKQFLIFESYELNKNDIKITGIIISDIEKKIAELERMDELERMAELEKIAELDKEIASYNYKKKLRNRS